MKSYALVLLGLLSTSCATFGSRSARCNESDLEQYRRLATRTLGRDILPPLNEDQPDRERPITLDEIAESCLVEDISTVNSGPPRDRFELRLLAIRNAERRTMRGELEVHGFTPKDVWHYYQDALFLAREDPRQRILSHHAMAVYLLAAGQGGQALDLLTKEALPAAKNLLSPAPPGDPYYLILVRDALASAYGQGGQFSQRNVQRCEAIDLAQQAYRLSYVTTLNESKADWQKQPACLRGTRDAFPTAAQHRHFGKREREAHYTLMLHFIEDLATELRASAIHSLLPAMRKLIPREAPPNMAHLGYYRTAEALAIAGDGPGALHFFPKEEEFVDMSATIERECYLGRILLYAGDAVAALEILKKCERYSDDAERISPFLKQDIGLAYLRYHDRTAEMIDKALKYFIDLQPHILAIRSKFDKFAQAAFFNSGVHWSFWGEIQGLLAKNPVWDVPKVEELLAKMDGVRARQFSELSSSEGQPTTPEPILIARIQERIGERGVLLSYLLMDKELLLVAVATAKSPMVLVIPVDTLNHDIDLLNRQLANPTTSEAVLAVGLNSISKTLLSKVWPLLAGKSDLFVIPDGKISMLPFDLLHRGDSVASKSLFDENYQVRIIPSLTAFLAAKPRQAAGPDRPLLVGNLQYLKKGVGSLPYTEQEIDAIQSLFVARNINMTSRVMQTVQATRDQVLEKLKDSSILHFATHAYVSQYPIEPLDQPNEDEPAILLSGTEVLRVSDIVKRENRLSADLTVLSACQTAVGPYQVGEGMLGLGRAFLLAGSRQVLASLWSVSDSATADLMKAFYQRYIPDRRNVLQALHEAKLAVRGDQSLHPLNEKDQRTTSGLRSLGTNQSRRHPYYWAGFVLITAH